MRRINQLVKTWILRVLPPGQIPRLIRWYHILYWAYRRLYRIVFRQGWPPGHFYSPVVDVADVTVHSESLFQKDVSLGADIDLREKQQWLLLQDVARYYSDFDWPEQSVAGRRYHLDNPTYCYGDAVILYCFLRHFQPKKVIEVGSGFSSALMLDTRDQFPGDSVQFTFIDPFSMRLQALLGRTDAKNDCTILKCKAQDVLLTKFQTLEANDILLIDSSHVVKTGSELNFIIFDILPSLNSGVIVHFHDVCWPFEYPKRWVVELRWSWNEAYLLRAFLQYNAGFEVLLFNNWLQYRYADFLTEKMPLVMRDIASSLWLQKV